MKNKIYIILLALFFSACSNDNLNETTDEQSQEFSISGHIKNAKGSINVQEIAQSGLILIDSSIILDDGSFELTGLVTKKTFCTIRLSGVDIPLLLDTATKIVIEIDTKNPDSYSINGGIENSELKILHAIMVEANNEAIAMQSKYEKIFGDNIPIGIQQDKFIAERDSLANKFNNKMKETALGFNSIVPYFISSFFLELADYNYCKAVDAKLFSQFSSSKYAIELHTRVIEMSRSAIGAFAPEIKLHDPFGKEIALSSLRGKIVLVDFWASWCAPCRKENPNVVKLYQKYKDKGFDVFGVSLDKNRENWIKAINDDKLLWNHVSDLMEWNSPLVKTYNFESIPHTVLIDREGKIIALNIRGNELESKLAEVFLK